MKLLLVDDEEYAREGLVARIDWDSLGITEIMTARNGIDGLIQPGSDHLRYPDAEDGWDSDGFSYPSAVSGMQYSVYERIFG